MRERVELLMVVMSVLVSALRCELLDKYSSRQHLARSVVPLQCRPCLDILIGILCAAARALACLCGIKGALTCVSLVRVFIPL